MKLFRVLTALLLVTAVAIGMMAVASAETTKIVFLHAGTDEGRIEAFKQIVAAFMEANPDIEVEIQNAAFGDDMETKLNTGFASGNAPDVMYFTMASMGVRIPMGQYEPLNAYAADWNGWDDYYKAALSLGSLGENLYGIPYYGDSRVVVINTEMAEAAGLDPNTPPTTWDELLTWHKALTVRDENGNVTQCGLGLPTSGVNLQHWLSIFGRQNGVKNLVDEATDEILLNTPAMVEALEFMNEIREIGVIPWDANHADQNPIANGTAAISIITSSDYATYNTGDVQGKLKMCSPIGNKQAGTFCGMHFLYMSSASRNKEAAWKLMDFMSQPEAIQIWDDCLGAAPLRESMRDAYIAQFPDSAPYILEAIASGVGSPKVSYSNSLFNITGAAVEKVFYGQATPQEALDEAASLVADEIAFQ